jgi:hypothetical protein
MRPSAIAADLKQGLQAAAPDHGHAIYVHVRTTHRREGGMERGDTAYACRLLCPYSACACAAASAIPAAAPAAAATLNRCSMASSLVEDPSQSAVCGATGDGAAGSVAGTTGARSAGAVGTC